MWMCLPEMACSLCPNPSKYKCPKCEARTCSLACVTAHKAATACDGRRDRTKFVAMGEMGDMEVVSDYRLLEEVSRGLDSCRRDKIRRSTRQVGYLHLHLHLHLGIASDLYFE